MVYKSSISALFFLFSCSHILSNVQANSLIATINVGITPAGIAITPDNNYAYVANNNNYAIAEQSNVSVINLTTNLVEKTINDASFNGPYTVTINPAGTKVYVTNSNSSTITIIDIASNTVTGTITGFDGPSSMVISPDGTTGYVNNYGAGGDSGTGTTVQVVDIAHNVIVGSAITVGLAPAGLAMTSDGAYIYVINYVDGNVGTGTVSVLQTSDDTIIATIPGFSGPFAIAISPDDDYAYVTNFGSNNFSPFGTTISVIDLNHNEIIDTINLGIQPAGIAITPSGNYAYATNYNTLYAGPSFTDLTSGQGTVNIINLTNNTVVSPTLAVGQSPAGIAISPNGQYAYVTNYSSNTVDVIALQSFQISAQGSQIQDHYLTRTELINRITWSASGSSTPVSYSIYRDPGLTNLVASISANQPLVLFDGNRQKNTIYTYYIVGTNEFGITSAPVFITVPAQPI